ncbi:MAG: MCE family protein [Solirubrobacteraceae bacterium]|nr:MCE family protein [Solirubrobacteraceae bacterium]
MSPALIGSIAVLLVVIMTTLAYNANRGLPWVPSQRLFVEVKNAANIVPGNEVRVGGTRIGIVETGVPKRYPDGTITAVLGLKLDQGTEPLPVDTTVLIRARSLLGLKYVQLTPGDATETFEWGAKVPFENSTPDPVEIDQLLNTFDDPTREGIISSVTAFGNALVGRGSIIGELLDDAGPLGEDIVPVVEVLADDQDGLVPFLTALSRFTGELAAAGESTGGLFRGLDRTTGAIARADASLDQTLAVAPDALTSTASSLAATRAAVDPHIAFASDLSPSINNLADGANDLAAASNAGVTGLAGVPRFVRDFDGVLDQLDRIGNSSVVARGLDGVTQLMLSGQPLFESFSRAQTVCSYPTRFLQNLASATSDGDSNGSWVRVTPLIAPYSPNNESVVATGPSTGAVPPAGAFSHLGTDAQSSRDFITNYPFLHSNPRPVTGAGGRCEPGYEVRAFPGVTRSPQQVTIGARSLKTTTPFRPAPPRGSEFRPAALDAQTEDEE